MSQRDELEHSRQASQGDAARDAAPSSQSERALDRKAARGAEHGPGQQEVYWSRLSEDQVAHVLVGNPSLLNQAIAYLQAIRGNTFARRVVQRYQALRQTNGQADQRAAPAPQATAHATAHATPGGAATATVEHESHAAASATSRIDDVHAEAGQDGQAQQAQSDADREILEDKRNQPWVNKAQRLLRWKPEMEQVATQKAPQFAEVGLEFDGDILLATAMQEADAKDPQNAVSFDNGLGIMQITPYKGDLDGTVAAAIGWDNKKSLAWNKHSRWRDPQANLLAGAETMLVKAKAIQTALPDIWAQMDQQERWRAVMFAYNAGQGAAIRALRRGGANARMISSFKHKGKTVRHDYTEEIQDKMDIVEAMDAFDAEA